MNAMRCASCAALLSIVLGVSACERIALMPRPDVDESGAYRYQSDVTRDSDRARPDRAEIVGTVDRIDQSRREIHLRESNRASNTLVLHYDPRTVVYDRDRTLEVDDLRAGDQVAVKTAPGAERYADVIRMIDRRSSIY